VNGCDGDEAVAQEEGPGGFHGLLLSPSFNSRNLKVSFSLVPIGQVALRLDAQADSIRLTLRTMTPNSKAYQMRPDRGPWRVRPVKA
jgi:hypothetical protein